VLKCFSIRESCLIFVSSLHFGGWLGCCNALLGGSATADATHLLSPTAREAGKPTIKPLRLVPQNALRSHGISRGSGDVASAAEI
jgi:hypothetical protein